MALTYVKIAESTVGAGGAAFIDFTSIPTSYTDLIVLSSVRFDQASDNGLYMRFNSDSGTNYNSLYLYGNGSSASSGAGATDKAIAGVGARSTATANTFANNRCYIPGYQLTQNKVIYNDAVNENNATAADAMLWVARWNNTAAITSIRLLPASGNLVQYSTAYLYGILKS